jgi:hypothetical protein
VFIPHLQHEFGNSFKHVVWRVGIQTIGTTVARKINSYHDSLFFEFAASKVGLPQEPTVREAMDENDEAGFAAWLGGGKRLDVVEFKAIAEGTELVRETVWTLIEVPEGISG